MLACLVPSRPQGYSVSSAMGPQLRTGATALAVHLMTDTGDPGTGQGPHGREATARSAIVKVRQPSCPTKERVR